MKKNDNTISIQKVVDDYLKSETAQREFEKANGLPNQKEQAVYNLLINGVSCVHHTAEGYKAIDIDEIPIEVKGKL